MAGGSGADLVDLSHADPARLRALWARDEARLTTASVWRPDELGDVLRHQLAASFGSSRAEPGEPNEPAGSAGDLLFRQAAPLVERLRLLKQWAKPNMSAADGDVPPEVAGVIYFAAIVCARVKRGERISGVTDQRLRQAIHWSLSLPWLDGETVALMQSGLSVLGSDG